MTTHGSGRCLQTAIALGFLALGAGWTSLAAQRTADYPSACNQPFPEPITIIKLSTATRAQIPTRDGCWVFAAMLKPQGASAGGGVGVLRRTGDTYEEVRFLPLPSNPDQPFGLALTHDQKVLVVSHSQQITFLDVEQLTSGQNAHLGQIRGPRIGYSLGVAITPDDKFAFVAQGQFASVLVIDLKKGRTAGFDESALMGVIPITFQPTIPVLSRDGRYLFAASKRPPDVISPTLTCFGGKQPEGAIHIIDAQKATSDARLSTIGFASPAGCNPMAVSISPDGTRLSVLAGDSFANPATPAADYALVVFDAGPVREGNNPTLIGKISLGRQPMGIVDTGSRILVGLMGPNSSVTVVDAARVASGKDAIIGSIPVTAAGGQLLDDGRTLIAGQGAGALVIIDLERVQIEKPLAK